MATFLGMLIYTSWCVLGTLAAQRIWRNYRSSYGARQLGKRWVEHRSEKLLRESQQRLHEMAPATEKVVTYGPPSTVPIDFTAELPCPRCGYVDVHKFNRITKETFKLGWRQEFTNSVMRQCDNCEFYWEQS